jgi:thiol:disulfide interchange protein DsbD
VTYTINPASPGVLTAKTSGAAPQAAEDDTSLAQRTLQSGSAWRIGGAFLVFGLLLSFTPCVLPMVPILSSIIVGEGSVTRKRGAALAGAYSIGMALVYTALGVAAGLAGEGLAGALQKPWVLLTFGALLFCWRCRCSTSTSCSFPAPCKAA